MGCLGLSGGGGAWHRVKCKVQGNAGQVCTSAPNTVSQVLFPSPPGLRIANPISPKSRSENCQPHQSQSPAIYGKRGLFVPLNKDTSVPDRDIDRKCDSVTKISSSSPSLTLTKCKELVIGGKKTRKTTHQLVWPSVIMQPW